ncbi:hypothetical protein MCAG_04794 [Micromonospora sp. ATCC 39149]|nr:hypothetical protein MCAG_04794 [Micromonospora sp. ATCC 39149]
MCRVGPAAAPRRCCHGHITAGKQSINLTVTLWREPALRGRVPNMPVPPLADATSAADVPGVRLLGLVVGGLLLLAAIRAMFGRR